jgi:hypothetical protein
VKNWRIRKPAAKLTHGTFLDFMRALTDTQLVGEETSTHGAGRKYTGLPKGGKLHFGSFLIRQPARLSVQCLKRPGQIPADFFIRVRLKFFNRNNELSVSKPIIG